MQNVIIFSVFRPEFADKNELNHESTIRALNDLGIKTTRAIGMYKGESEKSIVVAYNDYNYDQVISFARLFNQESILMISDKSDAHLLFIESMSTMPIGKVKETSEESAMNKDAYTYLPMTKQYFVAE